ncbi:hypothetical protein ABPG72_003164 [Tetrahymena utriculariae]
MFTKIFSKRFFYNFAKKATIPTIAAAGTLGLIYNINKDPYRSIYNESNQSQHERGEKYKQIQENMMREQEASKNQFSENDIITPTSQLFFSSESSQKSGLLVFTGSGNRELAKEVVSQLDIQLSRISIHKNPESETEIEILDSVRGKRVFVIQSMCQPNINDNIMELYLMCSALKRSGAAKVTCIVPYFAYSRQTSVESDKERRSLSGSDICLMLQTMGCDQVITINHGQLEVKGFFAPRVPILNIDVNEMVVPYLLEKGIENPVLIGAHLRSRNVKRLIGLHRIFNLFDQNPSLGFMIRGNADKIEYIGEEVKNRDCILFENLIDSGNSLQELALKLHKDGARRIFWFSPHGLFTDNAQKLIKNSYVEECIVTNTCEEVKPQHPKIQYLSVAKLLAEVISFLHSGHSLDQFRRSRSLLKFYSPPIDHPHNEKVHHQNFNRSQFTFHL